MTPKQIVSNLNKYIVGQHNAKRAVAIALRNRYRRGKLSEELKQDVIPKNILMIGPTGVGKTEIARRIAKLTNAPFIKVEATKFTEIGYVGRDVDSIIRDLADISLKLFKQEALNDVLSIADSKAEDAILDILLTPPRDEAKEDNKDNNTRALFRRRLQNGSLDDKEIEIDVKDSLPKIEVMAPLGFDDISNQLQSIFSNMKNGKTQKKIVTIKEAKKILKNEIAHSLVNEESIKLKALEAVEEQGIVFIDEIDKVAKRTGTSNADVSREGVQRDLLPLIEGSVVQTKLGMVKTDHILFIASGAFHFAKPSDLIPELQGRLPIRVELQALTSDDFKKILLEPKSSLIEQYKALLATENIDITFTDEAIDVIANIAYNVNETTENIGARRLHTIMEKLLEDILFDAGDNTEDARIVIDKQYAEQKLREIAKNEDLSRYIL